MPLHDVHYQHWQGESISLWRRRWAIARNGLKAGLENKAMRAVVVLTWGIGLCTVGVLFLVSQLLDPESMVVRWVEQLNPQLQGIANALTFWLHDHPEISVRTTQNVLFFYCSELVSPFSVFALGVIMPYLITRDLASSAIVIYSSKAISRGDYLLGKFSIAFGVLTLTWLGPLGAAWFVGNLLAPDWSFFWHARMALLNTLIFALAGMLILSGLALGVSAVSSREKTTPALWFAWWVLGYVIQPIALNTKPWLAHLSFTYNLEQIRLAIFRLGDEIRTSQDNIPLLGEMLRKIPEKTMDEISNPAVWSSVLALMLMLAVAAWILRRRVRPE